MLIDQLLLPIVLQNNRKVVKSPYRTPQLKAISQIDDYGNVFLTDLVQKCVLQVQKFIGHIAPPPSDYITILLDCKFFRNLTRGQLKCCNSFCFFNLP